MTEALTTPLVAAIGRMDSTSITDRGLLAGRDAMYCFILIPKAKKGILTSMGSITPSERYTWTVDMANRLTALAAYVYIEQDAVHIIGKKGSRIC